MLSGGNSNVPSPLLVIRWRQRTASRKATEGVKESIVSCASPAPRTFAPLYTCMCIVQRVLSGFEFTIIRRRVERGCYYWAANQVLYVGAHP